MTDTRNISEELPSAVSASSAIQDSSNTVFAVLATDQSNLLSRSSTDEFFPLPVEIRRTNSFPCIPGSEENSNAERGIDMLRASHVALQSLDRDGTSAGSIDDFDFSLISPLALEKPQLQKRVGTPMSPPKLSHRTVSKNDAMSTFMLAEEPNLPCKPFHLVNTHFYVDEKEIKSIAFTIIECFRKITGVSYKFTASNCLWETKCCDMLNYDECEMDVQIYKTSSDDQFIVEANRTIGNHNIFHQCYSLLKEAFVSEPSSEGDYDIYRNSRSSVHDTYASSLGYIPPISDFANDKDAKSAMEPILKMAESGYIDAQIEASRLFYDFLRNEDLHKYWCDERCMKVLTSLASPESPDTARHTVFMTLAELAGKSEWQELIIESGALPYIMAAVVNGSYQTAEMRREGARTLEYLSQSARVAHRISNSLGKEELFKWFGTVDGLTDERLKLHAVRARDALSSAMRMAMA